MAYFGRPGEERTIIPLPGKPSNKIYFILAGMSLIALAFLISPKAARMMTGGSTITKTLRPTLSKRRHTKKPVKTGYLNPQNFSRVELNPQILDDVLDQYDKKSRQPDEYSVIEKGPLINVLQYLMSHSEEEVESALTIPHPKLHPVVTYTDMMTRPRSVRGATVLVQGVVKLFGYSEYDPKFQAESGVEGFWYGNLFYKDKKQYAFRLLEDGDDIQVDDVIELYGVFVKRMWFVNRDAIQSGKNKYSIMPVVYAKRARRLEMADPRAFSTETYILLFIGLILVIVFGVTLMKEIRVINSRRRTTRLGKK